MKQLQRRADSTAGDDASIEYHAHVISALRIIEGTELFLVKTYSECLQ